MDASSSWGTYRNCHTPHCFMSKYGSWALRLLSVSLSFCLFKSCNCPQQLLGKRGRKKWKTISGKKLLLLCFDREKLGLLLTLTPNTVGYTKQFVSESECFGIKVQHRGTEMSLFKFKYKVGTKPAFLLLYKLSYSSEEHTELVVTARTRHYSQFSSKWSATLCLEWWYFHNPVMMR